MPRREVGFAGSCVETLTETIPDLGSEHETTGAAAGIHSVPTLWDVYGRYMGVGRVRAGDHLASQHEGVLGGVPQGREADLLHIQPITQLRSAMGDRYSHDPAVVDYHQGLALPLLAVVKGKTDHDGRENCQGVPWEGRG